MKQRTVCHRPGQVGGKPASRRKCRVDGMDDSAVVKSDIVIDDKIMPLAGDDHVVITVIAHLAGPSRRPRGDGAGHGQRVPLTFLAAEAAAHAPRLDPDRVHR